MAGQNNGRDLITASDLIGNMGKRILHDERRPQIRTAADVLGPGLAPKAVQLLDWNDAATAFNGIFFSEPGANNSPDITRYWMGTVFANDKGSGFQRVVEYRGTVDIRPQEWERTFLLTAGTTLSYGPWVRVDEVKTPFGVLTKSDAQALATGTLTTLTFDGGYGDAAVADQVNDRINVTRDGFWQVEGGFGWPALTGGTRGAFLYWHDFINNTENIIGSFNAGTTNTNLSAEVVTVTAREVPVLAGDWFYARSIQSSGSASTTSNSNGNQFLQGRWHRPV